MSMKKVQRILALAGVVLIVLMYAATLFFALSDSPNATEWLMASVFCTIAVPVVIYAYMLVYKYLKGRK